MSSSKSDGPQLVTKNIAAISETTKHMSRLFDSNFQRVDSVLGFCESHLKDSQGDVVNLLKDIINHLEILEDFVQGNPQHGEERLVRMEGLEELVIISESGLCLESGVDMFPFEEDEQYTENRYKMIKEKEFVEEQAQFVAGRDDSGQQDLEPTANLLKKTQDNLANFEDTSNKKFESLFKNIVHLEENTRGHAETQKQQENVIRRKLHQLLESVRSKANFEGR